MDIGKTIKDFREQQGMTQKEFAESLGTTSSYVSRLEANKRSVNVRTLDTLFENMGVELELNFIQSGKEKIEITRIEYEKLKEIERKYNEIKALVS